jgi:hypothetical protein
MLHLLIYATAVSRLHADLAIVRLNKAGIAMSQISILHPPLSRPNSALWLDGSAEFSLSSGESVLVSGFLRSWLHGSAKSDDAASLADRLAGLGLVRGQSSQIEESLLERRVVVAIAEWDESKLPAIFDCLHGVGAEHIREATIDRPLAPAAAYVPAARRAQSPIARALAITNLVA